VTRRHGWRGTVFWCRNWPEVNPFFAFPAELHRIISTTTAIEAVHAKLRPAVSARGLAPRDDAMLKLLFLVLDLAAKEWRVSPRKRIAAETQFATLFEDRFTTT
jgi:putative transposase